MELFDPVLASRIQFAMTAMFHFLFVPLTLGLSMLAAIFQTLWLKTKDEDYRRAARFWGKLFFINFAMGVVTGITLEFQFGTNWRYYSEFVGDVFGPLLAIEATWAFFLESVFIAVWWFGWNRLNPKVHTLAIWLVAFSSLTSAFWILLANGWMQNPVGYVLRNDRAELECFWTVLTNPYGLYMFFHTIPATYVLTGFFVLGVSAWHLVRKNEVTFFKKSFKVAAVWTLIFSIMTAAVGDFHGKNTAKVQPEKIAAAEAIWETKEGAGFPLILIPDEENERNIVEFLEIPAMVSFLAYGDFNAEVKGLKEWPKEERPPVALTFWGFRIMIALGFLFIAVSIWAFLRRNTPESSITLLKILPWMIPLSHIAMQAGWLVTEVGRQPWIVYRLMKTADAVSPISAFQANASLFAFTVIYTILGVVCFWLMVHMVKKGPEKLEAAVEKTS